MTNLPPLDVSAMDVDALSSADGLVAVIAGDDGTLDAAGRKADALTNGAVTRAIRSTAFQKDTKTGKAVHLAFPAGMSARGLLILKLDRDADRLSARLAGGTVGADLKGDGALICVGDHPHATDIALGAVLRAYAYRELRSGGEECVGRIGLVVDDTDRVDIEAVFARAEGVFLARDLVNMPANVLTTERFADELLGLGRHDVGVDILDEAELEAQGLCALLAVGRGSESPSKLVVMRWQGSSDPPVALVGKGVVFDTGGISMKPAAGMEEMTMDMGGAAVVAGVMKSIALGQVPVNVVGVVGLVENMPDGRAQRPGDVVRSLKGETIEVINTDAEGRLVLADAMWYVQERFSPRAVIDLATLTGAMLVSLGLEKAGIFSNDDALCHAVLTAASAEGEGIWRLPLDPAYAKPLESRIADLRNVGSDRWAGAIVAAEFLQRFVKPGTPWCHLDIAGVTSGDDRPTSPKGPTGWGVLTLDAFLRTFSGES